MQRNHSLRQTSSSKPLQLLVTTYGVLHASGLRAQLGLPTQVHWPAAVVTFGDVAHVLAKLHLSTSAAAAFKSEIMLQRVMSAVTGRRASCIAFL
jgi:hypothetical protein